MKIGFESIKYDSKNARVSQYKNQNINRNIAFGDSLGIIKPEAMHLRDFIFQEIKRAGFKVEKAEITVLSDDLVNQHYFQLRNNASELFRSGKNFLMNIWKRVRKDMQVGPVERFIIKGDEAEADRFKQFVGATLSGIRSPKSLRAKIEAKFVENYIKQGKSQKFINDFKNRYTFVHASDIDWFDSAKTIKNYDREIQLHYGKNSQVS